MVYTGPDTAVVGRYSADDGRVGYGYATVAYMRMVIRCTGGLADGGSCCFASAA